jgi:hypothetical protein
VYIERKREMPRGDTNPRGMPPSRNTVWVKPEIEESEFDKRWAAAFGNTEGNRQAVSKFERPQGKTIHRIKRVDDMGKF